VGKRKIAHLLGIKEGNPHVQPNTHGKKKRKWLNELPTSVEIVKKRKRSARPFTPFLYTTDIGGEAPHFIRATEEGNSS